jgi:hypothetical protein
MGIESTELAGVPAHRRSGGGEISGTHISSAASLYPKTIEDENEDEDERTEWRPILQYSSTPVPSPLC